MLYRFISWFLFFTALNIIYEIDFYFAVFAFLVLLVSIILAIDSYRTFLSDIYKMSFIILMSFITSWVAVLYSQDTKQEFHLDQNLYRISGKIVGITTKDNLKNVSLEVAGLVDLSDNSNLESYPNYLKLAVSPLHNYKLFDQLEVIGEISTANFTSNRNISKQNFIPQKYAGEKLFLNTKYQVSNIKNVSIRENEFYKKSLWEKIQIKFYETSQQTQERISKHIKEPYLGIAQGIAFGNQENIIRDIRKSFTDSGLIHIMVLSGANVSFIILVFFFILQKINLRTRVFATSFLSVIFIFATGLTAPSVRAGVMVNSVLLAEYFSKNFSIKNSILLSLFILTLINPHALVYSASLHLSYLAIFGLVFVVPKLHKLLETNLKKKNLAVAYEKFEVNILLNIFKNNFWKGILVTFLAITISVGPYLLVMSEKINLFGTIATLFLEPIILVVTILTFLTTVFSFVSLFLADILGLLNTFFISIILHTAEFLSHNIFILNLSINHTFVKIYYLIFIVYFFVLNFDSSD